MDDVVDVVTTGRRELAPPRHLSTRCQRNVAILLAMSQNVSLAEVKDRLSEFVERVEREHDRVVITKHGRPAAVVVSIDDLDSLEETLAILSDPTMMADLAAARADHEAGRVDVVTRQQLLDDLTS